MIAAAAAELNFISPISEVHAEVSFCGRYSDESYFLKAKCSGTLDCGQTVGPTDQRSGWLEAGGQDL